MIARLPGVACQSGSARKPGSSSTESASGIFLCGGCGLCVWWWLWWRGCGWVWAEEGGGGGRGACAGVRERRVMMTAGLGPWRRRDRRRARVGGASTHTPPHPHTDTTHLHDVVHKADKARQHLRRRLGLFRGVAGELWVAVEQADKRGAQQQEAEQLQAGPGETFEAFVGARSRGRRAVGERAMAPPCPLARALLSALEIAARPRTHQPRRLCRLYGARVARPFGPAGRGKGAHLSTARGVTCSRRCVCVCTGARASLFSKQCALLAPSVRAGLRGGRGASGAGSNGVVCAKNTEPSGAAARTSCAHARALGFVTNDITCLPS